MRTNEIAYTSLTLIEAEKNYSTTENESLAIVYAIRQVRSYLKGYHCDVITDHISLKWFIESPLGKMRDRFSNFNSSTT